MDQYPHEILLGRIKKRSLKTGTRGTFAIFLAVISLLILIIATAITTILFLILPREPKAFTGIIAGMILIGIFALINQCSIDSLEED